jgi:uncharacterized protein
MISTGINKEYILAALTVHQEELQKFGVKQVGLFGSFVRNEATDESDIDLLVDIAKEKKTIKNLVGLGDFLETLFQRKVEIVTPQSLSKYIGPFILKEVEYAPFRN